MAYEPQAPSRKVSNSALRPVMARPVARMGEQSLRALNTSMSAFREDHGRLLANATMRRDAALEELRVLESSGEAQRGGEASMRAQQLRTFVQKQVDKRMEGHKPHFTRIITVIQFILIVLMLFLGDLAEWGLGVDERLVEVDLFVGTGNQLDRRSENPYYGPDVETLVEWGSKWAPCMREEQTVLDFEQEALDEEEGHVCCVKSNNECGMVSPATCISAVGTIVGSGEVCSEVSPDCDVIVRPCCFGIFGQCSIITNQHCDVLRGSFGGESGNEELCANNRCIFQQCGLGQDKTTGLHASNHPNQFYRFFIAIFLHVGVIHFLLNALGQYVLVSQVEFVAGFWRTAVMYLVSGSGGFLISALFSADVISNGSSAAIYGMLGVETVDLFQTWQLIPNKFAQTAGLVVKLIIFLGIGTLPFIDNFAHVGGFVTGVVVGIWLLPYIVFGKLDEFRKKLCQVVAITILVALVIGLLFKFYTDPSVPCSFCEYINCVPYTDSICDYDQEINE